MNRPIAALTAGFVGTLPFLGMVRTFPKLDALEVDLIRTAVNLLSSDERHARVLKIALPLALGSAFALPYAALWKRGWGRPDLLTGATFGVAHGLVIILARPAFRLAHPRPFDLPQSGIWVVGELLSHTLYGVSVALLYRALEPKK